MSVEDRVKESGQTFAKRLQIDLAAQIEEFVVELARAAEEERAAAVAEATEKIADEARRAAEQAAAPEITRLKADIERLQVEIDQAVSRARQEAEDSFALERARVAFEREADRQSSLATAVGDERQAQMQSVERLLTGVRRFDDAESLTDILGALVEGAAAEAPRVALLTVQGDRVRGWRLVGFGDPPPAIDLDRRQAGVVTQALEQGEVAFAEPAAPGQTLPSGPGFTALPPDRSGIAMPIRVGGAPVAVLYADDVATMEQAKPASWPEAIEILVRHAALRLENLTAVRAAQAIASGAQTPAPVSGASATGEDAVGGARRYARLLVAEIKLYNEAAVRVGRQKADLLERLRDEIGRARNLYEERVPVAVRTAHSFFDDELVQTLAGGDLALLGRRSDALA